MRPWRDWESYALVFGASVCTLVLEIVAGRVLAPAIGVSLYTWTTVIGVVLAGVAVGNYAGGRIARTAGVRALAGLFLTTAIAVWLAAAHLRMVDLPSALSGVQPLARLVLLVGGYFFTPSFLLGMVTPLVAQLMLRERAEAGAVVGRLGAVSAAGSIVGTFAAGFLLIPAFGSRSILMGVAVALALLALLTAWGRVRFGGREVGRALPLAALVAAVTGCSTALGSDLCLRETAYYCIRLEEGRERDARYLTLIHDRTIQGFTAPEAPLLLVADYVQVFADAAAYRAARLPSSGAALQTLFIGGGSFTMPRYLEAAYPQSLSEVLEVDVGVTRTAGEHLGLRQAGSPAGPPSRGIHVRHVDARLGIRDLAGATYDLVYGDAFSDISVPWHLTTLEFDREVRRVLKPDGLYVINAIDAWETGRFLPAFVRTLREAFPHVTVMRVRDFEPRALSNWVLIASGAPIDTAALERVTRPGLTGAQAARGRAMPADEVARWAGGALVLTDDYAPVDWLLSGRYLD
ncbi:MAG TPA: fused MFS/spermidine synthase [Chloroflexota bacterium]|nr:fused MFS/spermidine synthase [Chloroflexota bacterium]